MSSRKISAVRGDVHTPEAELRIDTGDGKPVNVKQYRVAQKHMLVVDVQVNKWCDKGQVTDQVPIDCQWNIPLLAAPKRDGATHQVVGQRICLDPRLVNLMTPDSSLPMPIVEEVLEALNGSVVFSKLDQEAGYHQFRLRPEDQVKTTFTWRGKRYMFIVPPFGYKNFPQEYHRVMVMIFDDMSYCLVFLDDLIVYSACYRDHYKHVRAAIERLTKYNLRLGLQKCVLGRPELIILGHSMTAEGRKVVEGKLIVIEEWKPPTTGKMLQSQLGFFNYFRSEIPLYSRLFAPLEKLRYAAKIDWCDEYQRIYDQALSILKSKLMLAFPDYDKPFFVSTDASKFGVGAVLYQEDTEKRPKYVKFVAKSLRFSAAKLPCYASRIVCYSVRFEVVPFLALREKVYIDY
jgi:hypothetical protein